MSSCISGGGRTYAFDIEIPKPPSPSTLIRTPHSQSPSSTLSESSNSPIAISTRKPRTPRKRPNQTYNEAATLLSMAYPKIFPPEHLPPQPCKIIARPQEGDPFLDSADMLLPFRAIDGLGCLLGPPRFQPKALLQLDSNCKTAALICDEDRYRDGDEESRKLVGCSSPGLSRFSENCSRICSEGGQAEEEGEDFGAESILDEEIGEGIDSIMGRQCDDDVDSNAPGSYCNFLEFPGSGKFGGSGDCGFGNAAAAALRNVDREGDWWRFPTVDIREISPKLNRVSPPETEKKKDNKKKNKKKRTVSVSAASAGVKSCGDSAGADSIPKPTSRPNLLLKLNYEEVLRAWSDQGSPFPEAFPGTQSAGADDTHARLAQMDLFAEEGGGGGLREASVMRYKEKRRTRLFSKKIRYQVRKVNADLRPRMKGRFVRRAINLKAEQEA